MIVECGLIGLVGYGYYLYKTMDKRELISDFNKSRTVSFPAVGITSLVDCDIFTWSLG